MPLTSNLARSADLMTGLMGRMGKVVLAPNEVPSLAQARKIRNMVYRCAACPDQRGCAALQATALHLDSPPAYCPNADALTALPSG
ncbi:DUF6455 family protein [uncultured Tateyamaria sp.]|uniref:DUF6455 family protein n=1 Tax=uncultured Tateyamaria sp. TaxID=455651 RepID=UPI002612707A|nr:DUF6455 family protein [uncultured Tateyamaria sp.]